MQDQAFFAGLAASALKHGPATVNGDECLPLNFSFTLGDGEDELIVMATFSFDREDQCFYISYVRVYSIQMADMAEAWYTEKTNINAPAELELCIYAEWVKDHLLEIHSEHKPVVTLEGFPTLFFPLKVM